ncbi:MAG: hypothetical protein HY000_20475 [Planctomycetes bacterium]|nr:hypothetical protein [Planctomycetota bacterium]
MEGSRPPQQSHGDSPGPAVDWGPRLLVPSWLISLVIHAALLIVFAVAFKATPQGAVAESVVAGGIVLKSDDPATEEYLTEEDFASEEVTAAESAIASPADALDSAPPSDPASALPDTRPVIGAGPLQSGTALSAAGMDSGPGRRVVLEGGRTRTGVFGVEGEGSKFVYVFDRSGSMGGAGRNALRAAKIELLKSLESLDQIHQFQIIFYNERATVFALAGQPGRLVFGNEASKLQAQRFINSIVADGGTQHEDALMQALRMRPDVIFFLTDGADPELSGAQLARIRKTNGGQTSINVVEFGLGPASSSYNFLQRLARENGGKYGYVDITHLKTGN